MPASRITGTRGALDDDLDVVRVADAHPGADRRAERHHGGAAHVLEAAGEDRVVVGVGQDREALVDQCLGRLDQLDRVGEEGAVVADHLELDPVGLERLARETGGAHRVARRVAARRCSGGRTARGASITLQRRARAQRVDAAQRDGDDLGPRGDQRPLHHLQRAKAAGADDQPGAPGPPPSSNALVTRSRGAVCGCGLSHPGPPARPRPSGRSRAPSPPLGARHHLAVDGDRDAAASAVRARLGDGVGHAWPRRAARRASRSARRSSPRLRPQRSAPGATRSQRPAGSSAPRQRREGRARR